MSRLTWNRFFAAALFAAAIFAAGCAADEKPPAPSPDAGSQPKLLSSLNDVNSTPVNPFAINQVPERGEGMLVDHGPVSAGPRTYQTEPGISRVVGNEENPGTVRLLNSKAAKFGSFSGVILDRIYAQLIKAERTEEISRTRLPTETKAVVITAVLDKRGKLTELILEQHSGKSNIDQMMLDVCRKSIWYENPPVEALASDGTYQLTIRLKLENYASSDETHWNFITDLGLGIS
jgi:hypothetical protein